jgi:ECF transporter S component (folate family)
MLIAIEVVLRRFCSITTPIVTIGFGFVPIAICGALYGPLWAGAAGALADIIGATLFPIGAFFPGFTVSAFLTGVVFGLFLRNKEKRALFTFISVTINCLGISLCLSTYWLTVITGTPFLVLLPTRIAQNAIMLAIQLTALPLLQRPVVAFAEKVGFSA